MRSYKIIVFLGVDGSGKSTLINELLKNYKNKFKKIHFAPDYFRNKNRQNTNPHKQLKRSKIFSFLKIIYWFINHGIFKILNYKSKKIFIFDRYIGDLLIDPKRYRFSLSDKFLEKIISYLIKPDLIVLLSGDPQKIYLRKKELKLKDLILLNYKYEKFVKKFKNILILNSVKKIHHNRDILLNHLNNF